MRLSWLLRRFESSMPTTEKLKMYQRSQRSHFASRTVLVDPETNNVEAAMKTLNGLMIGEGMLARWKLTRRYEKPTWMRNRLNYERARDIYNEDMANRVKFLMRKNRTDPYPGTNS